MTLNPSLFVLSFLLLTGCAGIYGESFDCPPGEGVRCTSISEVNALVDRGEIGLRKKEPSSSADSASVPPGASSPAESLASLPLFDQTRTPSSPSEGAHAPSVIRRPERVMRVWVPAHQEASGAWVGETTLYTVIEPGAWIEEGKAAPSASPSPLPLKERTLP